MHVHVTHTDGEAKFWLEPQIELAMRLVQDHYEEIIHAWRRYF